MQDKEICGLNAVFIVGILDTSFYNIYNIHRNVRETFDWLYHSWWVFFFYSLVAWFIDFMWYSILDARENLCTILKHFSNSFKDNEKVNMLVYICTYKNVLFPKFLLFCFLFFSLQNHKSLKTVCTQWFKKFSFFSQLTFNKKFHISRRISV